MNSNNQSIDNLAEFKAIAENGKSPVVIFDSGVTAKRLLAICRSEQVEVACFCVNEQPQSCTDIDGLPVLSLSQTTARYPNAIYLIASTAVSRALRSIKSHGITRYFLGGLLLSKEDVQQPDGKLELDWGQYQAEICMLTHQAFSTESLFLRSSEIIITERCSLKCKDCSNLMQYYTKPEHSNLELTISSLKNFFSIMDDIIELRILGGEPFMNKDWPKVVECAVAEPKVRRIVVITNGTIVPEHPGWEVLRNPKIHLQISNYGAHSCNLAKLVQFANHQKIRYWVYTAESWNDCAKVQDYGRTDAENRAVFENCWSKEIWTTISNGKLFRCPYSANTERLGATPSFPDDYFNLLATNKSREELREGVRRYLTCIDKLNTCGYCSGVVESRNVPPALQTRRPLPYQRYSVL